MNEKRKQQPVAGADTQLSDENESDEESEAPGDNGSEANEPTGEQGEEEDWE
ncbi:hypothetical protein ABW21_db0208127 [Orbilia brochopaga]|nr:hypothetical protein ABW21_db0208127 [Drechslerella brochopaga]